MATGLAAGLLLVSCDQDAPPPPETGPATPAATASPPVPEVPLSGARAVVEQTDDFLFEYSYPAEAGNIPELAVLLNRRLDRLRNQLAAESAEARSDARDNGFPYNKYSTGVEWKTVAQTPQFLSLSASLTSYTGGAHGNYGFDALVWDKERAIAVDPEAFFSGADALEEALGEKLCAALNAERAKRRGAPVAEGSDDVFDACVPLSDTTVLLGSRSGRAFDRIGVQIGPYVAGSYAEGSFEFTFDVDARILAAVAEEYRSAFAARN